MLHTAKISVDDIHVSDVQSIKYHPLSENEEWKVVLIKWLNDAKNGNLEVEKLSYEEIVCSS